MKAGPLLAAGIAGLAVGVAALLPAHLRLREDLADARTALAAIGPSVLVRSPQEIAYQSVRVEAFREDAPQRPTPEAGPSGQEPAGEGLASPGENPRFARRRDEDTDRDDPEVREARRQEFIERMRQRADASRTEFVERAALTEEQTARLDNLVFDMNLRAESIVADWVAYIRETGSFDTDFRIRFGHDLTAAMIAAYDTMDQQLPETWRTASGDFDLLRLVDPEIMRPMTDLQREMGVRGGFFGGLPGGLGRGGPGRGGPRTESENGASPPSAQ